MSYVVITKLAMPGNLCLNASYFFGFSKIHIKPVSAMRCKSNPITRKIKKEVLQGQ